MIRKLLLCTSLLAGSIGTQAQMTSYTMIHSSPDDYRRSTVYLDLFTADTWLNPNLGSGFKLETVLLNRIMPWLQTRYSWADANTTHAVSGYPTAANGLKKQLIIDAGGALFLVNKNKNKRVKVVLSSHSFGGYTHTSYLMVPSTVKRLFGVEGGIYYDRRALAFDDASHAFYTYKSIAAGGYTGPIGEAGNSPSGLGAPTGEFYKPLSMTHVMSIYGGLHSRKITNTTISTGSHGTCSNSNIFDLYADLMVAPVIPIADVVDNSGQKFELIKGAGAVRNLGWRAGMAYHRTRAVSFEYNFELGQKPGPIMGKGFLDNGTYISMGMGLAIGFNKQFSAKTKTVTKEKETTTQGSDSSEK